MWSSSLDLSASAKTMYRPYSLVAIAVFATGTPALAGDYGAPAPSALPTESAGDLAPLNTLAGDTKGSDNRSALSPAMFAALEDLSKKSVADTPPAVSQPQ